MAPVTSEDHKTKPTDMNVRESGKDGQGKGLMGDVRGERRQYALCTRMKTSNKRHT